MKQKQFTNEQVVAVLSQAEKGEKPIVEVCREHGITENTFYRWRNKFGSDPRRTINTEEKALLAGVSYHLKWRRARG